MKKYAPYLAVFLVFILSLVFFLVKGPKVVGNEVVINEITRIEQLSVMDEDGNNNLTASDLRNLRELAKGDRIAEGYANELMWLVEHNESQHLFHATSFMRDYIETGIDTPCTPHELQHISLFIKHGDIDYAKSQLKSADESYDKWVKNIGLKRESYPQFYKGLEQLEQMSRDSIEKLKQNDYSNETLVQLDLIGAAEVC